jgi:hypothetical protein
MFTMSPVIVSFYTPAYEAEAREMERTARAFGFFTDVRAVPDLGDWCANCAQKPAFIRDRMRDYPGRPVVWLDADARVRKPPVLLCHLRCDFAAHWRYGVELLSGTMLFNPTPAAMALAERWCEAQQRAPGTWDQQTLQKVVEFGAVDGLKVHHLPPEYTAIFDARLCPPDEVVIEHMQASRRLAHRVKCAT